MVMAQPLNETGETSRAIVEAGPIIQVLMSKKRDTNKYECYQGSKLVYVGITNDMERREAEHRADGMEFTSMRKVGNITTQQAASDWETERIHTYQQHHGGSTPPYNKNTSGK